MTKKWLVTIEFESEWSNPNKWQIEEILDCSEGESAYIVDIKEIE